jgi:hypothetical protein
MLLVEEVMVAQTIVGWIFVVLGTGMFVLQALLLIFPRQKGPAQLAAEGDPLKEIVGALIDKLPLGALGVAGVWLGSHVLGWWA